ncbi:hypothetical protein N5T62_05410 [Aliarcobacter cryaerophilus]|uniref:hypothetical protein n=1 Tax=Aliarcobacter cryaerophilus TaxID=28198 RepID=UPI0021B35135|nr:hypothetical protein [Aliarcobacter cryaerophilus]MCT7505514.1 hypothetical protein [Aliarcobacter cryaerophilus]
MLMYVYATNCTEGIKNIKEVVNAKIDSYSSNLEDIEDLEECKAAFIDFALEVRKQMNLLSNNAYIGILEQCFQNYLNTFCKNIF